MVTQAQQIVLSKLSQDAVVRYLINRYAHMKGTWNLRGRLEQIDRTYQREIDRTVEQRKAKLANRRGDPNKFQNVTVPVVLPQVENAVTYQVSVFLTGYPIFSAVTGPGNEDAAMQMDTLIGEQQIKARWVTELTKAIRDGMKYNLMAAEVDWKRISQSAGVEEQTRILWQGNYIKRLDLYNTFWDIRVPPDQVSTRGEFQGYNELYSKIALKEYLHSLPQTFNVTAALESPTPGIGGADSIQSGNYYIPQINPESFIDTDKLVGFDWNSFMGVANQSKYRKNIAYKDLYQVTTLYAKILPSDFGINVPGRNIPQAWKFIIVNNSVVVYAERMSNIHNYLPIQFAQPYNDGLGYQTKSLAQNVMPFQEIATALANSTIHAKRRALVDRLLYDQSRVNPAHLNSDSPVARIPIKPSAFGKGLGDAVAPLPFNDSVFQAGNNQEMQNYLQMANAVSGLNPARQGQFVKGNKTRYEFAEIMSYANGRDQLMALSLEGDFFTPIKEIIKANILQYQSEVEILNREAQQIVRVDPRKLKKATLEFKMSDGLIPSDKLVDGESLALAFQTLQAVPQLAAEYNLGPMFSYLMKMRGARLANFEKSPEQIAYEQAVMQWQQAVAMIAEQIRAIRDITPEQLQQLMRSIPPQPLPQQFGYEPSNQQVRTNQQVYGGRSILDNLNIDTGESNNPGAGQGSVAQEGE